MVQREYRDAVKEALDATYGFNLQKEVTLPKGRQFKFALGDPENKVVVDVRPSTEFIEIEFISIELVPYIGEAKSIFGPKVRYFLVYESDLYNEDKERLESIITENSEVDITILDLRDIFDLGNRNIPPDDFEDNLGSKAGTFNPKQQDPVSENTSKEETENTASKNSEYNHIEFLALPEVQERHFFVVGAQWGNHEQSLRFIDQGVWENGITNEAVKHLVNTIQVGDILIQRGSKSNPKNPSLYVTAMGIVTENFQNEDRLKVDWVLHNFGYSIPSIEGYTENITAPSEEEIAQILKPFNNVNLGKFSKKLIPIIAPHTLQTLAGLISDADIGEDYLDITKDVAAFSRVIAAKNFLPPLAIALFGKWGSGKSFFMRKLKEQIEELSAQQGGTHFCSGIAQVHFNAWSYMDTNLWASMVTRIFEGLQQYISNDTKAKDSKKAIEKALNSKLNSTTQELERLQIEKNLVDSQLSDLQSKKTTLKEHLDKKIKSIKENTLLALLKKVDTTFNVETKIKTALENNPSMKQNIEEFSQIVPKEYWKTPDELYEQTTSTVTFLKYFFDAKNWWRNILWMLGIIIIIIGVPLAVSYIGAVVGLTDLSLSPETWSLLTIVGGLTIRGINTYTKMQPLVASFWEIRKDYAIQKEKATQTFEQEQKALAEEVENIRREIETLNHQITLTTQQKTTLQFKLDNALSTEALYSFIERKSESKDYAKHLGIISTIRKDFEILSELFTDHTSEVKKLDKETTKRFLKLFNHPLERIILYIDDLDRCPEERVVEVLEAVNLLMAYPLFVVVVGVDPRWVKNALYKRHQLQFTSQNENNNLEVITPSAYLEKIFQVPFNLKKASDSSVKFMLKTLAETKPLSVLTSESVTDSLTEKPAIETSSEASEKATLKDETILKPTTSSEETTPLDANTSLSEAKKLPPIEIESLTFSESEITLIQTMSPVVGSSPRAIKRFVNIFRIVKAHEDYPNNMSPVETSMVLFLLALPIGKYKNLYFHFTDFMKLNGKNEKIETFFTTLENAKDPNKLLKKSALELKKILASDGTKLLETSCSKLSAHYPLLQRFSYVID